MTTLYYEEMMKRHREESSGDYPFKPFSRKPVEAELAMIAPKDPSEAIEPDHAIQVWSFHKAPKELRRLSTNGGDEDWIALVPPSMSWKHIGWLEEGSVFGCCTVEIHDHPELADHKVHIGCHA